MPNSNSSAETGRNGWDEQLREWSRSQPLELTSDHVEFLENRVNDERERIRLEFQRDERVVLRTKQYVGIIALPDGPTIEIQPKAAGENFLWLIQYARDARNTTFDTRADILAGRAFLDAIAALYLRELEQVVQRGLYRSYKRTQATEQYLRGQLNPQKQLQRQGVGGTRLECTYDDLTYDIITNRAVLYATSVLKRLASESELRSALERYESLLRKRVTLTHVKPSDVADIQTSRLNDYYTDLLQLAELVIRNVYVENLSVGTRGSFSLLIDMNQIYEKTVERAAHDVAEGHDGVQSVPQAKLEGLVSGGKFKLRMRPDFLFQDSSGDPLLIGDAKWKTGKPQQSDQYQLAAYQLANESPGILVYPEQDGAVETEYVLQGEYAMRLVELPTANEYDSFTDFKAAMKSKMKETLVELTAIDRL